MYDVKNKLFIYICIICMYIIFKIIRFRDVCHLKVSVMGGLIVITNKL